MVPGRQQFVLGTESSVRLIDQRAHELWPKPQPVPDVAWHVNVTGDGRLAVVAYGDGTIRWLRLSDGKELLALFIHPDGKRWVTWTPQGYYDASVGGDDLIGWHVNHGYDRAPDFYPVAQFRDRFYRPEVIRRVLQTLDVEAAVRAVDRDAGRSGTKAASVSSLLTPVVEINDPKDPAPVIGYNANGASEPASIHIQWRGPGTDPKLTLYVLAIGVSNYEDKTIQQLHYAAKDASDFVALAKAQEGGLYDKVITHPRHGSLRDDEATKEAILEELDWITHALTNTNNVAMIFLSGHGITTADQHYRFLPYDYNSGHDVHTAISDSELKDYLTKIGGKKIFFFDTCYSGAVLTAKTTKTQPDADKLANDLKAAQNGIVVFTSSTGNEFSLEKDEWNNGAFAKAVVEGLHGAAARPGVPVIVISDLDGYVSRRVKELTSGNQRPVMAMPGTVEDFPIAQRLK